MSRYANVDKLMKHAVNLEWSTLKWVNEVDICTAINPNVVERKRGKWIMHINDLFPAESTMECDQCHERQPVTIDDNYCPNCGAYMRKELVNG